MPIATCLSASPDAKGLGVLTNVTEIAMKRIQQGFTLIELMIVVAIVGILAAIALPAYQDYVIRSKMSEGVAAAAACKTSISEYVSTKTAWPADADTAGCSTLATTYVPRLTVADNGVITVTTQNTGSKRWLRRLRSDADAADCRRCPTSPAGRVRTAAATPSTFRRTSAKRSSLMHPGRRGFCPAGPFLLVASPTPDAGCPASI